MPSKAATRKHSSDAERGLVIVCYDVTDEKRRRLIADTLENFGVRVQESVFECFIEGEHLTRLCREISAYVNPEEDAVCYYLLCGKDCSAVRTLGHNNAGPHSGYGVV